jgi:hypothetical protein
MVVEIGRDSFNCFLKARERGGYCREGATVVKQFQHLKESWNNWKGKERKGK